MVNKLKILLISILSLLVLAVPLSVGAVSATMDLDPPRAPSVVFPRNAATGGKVILKWQIPVDPTLVGFKVYRTTISGSLGDLLVTLNAGTSSIQDAGLTDGTTYYYTVASFDANNNESFAAQVSATPTTNSAALYPEKTLLRFEGRSTVYKVNLNGRTLSPVSRRVFDTNRYDFDDVLVIPIEWQSSFSYGSADTFRDGSLLKGAGQLTVYVLEDSKKRPFVSQAVFEGLGYSFSNVNEIPVTNSGLADAIDSYETGVIINSTGSHPSGTLIRVASDYTVYLVEGNQKKPISSASIFNSYHYDFSDVVIIPVSELNIYTTSSNLKFMDSALIKGNTQAVYVVDNNSSEMIPFRSAVELVGLGYNFGNVISVSDADVANYTIVSPFAV